jgi:hypothetical protein
MFPRVTHPSATPVLLRAFDLHVLSLPPAFVLSQDQTLKFNLKISIPTGHCLALRAVPFSENSPALTLDEFLHRIPALQARPLQPQSPSLDAPQSPKQTQNASVSET